MNGFELCNSKLQCKIHRLNTSMVRFRFPFTMKKMFHLAFFSLLVQQLSSKLPDRALHEMHEITE